MANIKITYSFLGSSEDEINNNEANIIKFKEAADEVLNEIEGEYTFYYEIKHKQFGIENVPIDLTGKQVSEIENLYPNCFLS